MRSLALFLAVASIAFGQDAEAQFRLGISYSQKGDHAKAREAFLAALKLAPDSIPVLNNLGVNALQRGDEREAERWFHQVLTQAPNDPNAAYNLGLIELKQKRFEPAAEHLRKAPAQDLAAQQGLLEAEIGSGRATRVSDAVERILRIAPGEPGFYFQLASSLSDRGYHEPAVRVLRQAQSLWPDSPDVAYNLAVVCFLSEDFGAARKAAEPVLEKGDRADLRHLLGDIYEKLNLYDRAVEAFQAAVRLDPDREDYHFALGYEFLLHHNFELAEQIFSAAAARLPRALKLRLGLAAACFARVKYDKAIEELKAAIELAPRSDLGYAFLARAFLLLRDHENLFAGGWLPTALEQYVKLKPDDPFACYAYAVSLRADPPKSQRLLERALKLDPGLAEAHLEIGKLYIDAGRFPDAIAAFENAVRLKPDLVEAHYRLFRAYSKAGKAEKAREASEVFQKKQKEQESQASSGRRKSCGSSIR